MPIVIGAIARGVLEKCVCGALDAVSVDKDANSGRENSPRALQPVKADVTLRNGSRSPTSSPPPSPTARFNSEQGWMHRAMAYDEESRSVSRERGSTRPGLLSRMPDPGRPYANQSNQPDEFDRLMALKVAESEMKESGASESPLNRDGHSSGSHSTTSACGSPTSPGSRGNSPSKHGEQPDRRSASKGEEERGSVSEREGCEQCHTLRTTLR